MRTIQVGILAILTVFIIIAPSSTMTYAITGNYKPDTTKYSCVGLVVFCTLDENGSRMPVARCTGILLSPRVMLTAAHSCIGESVTVCFDEGPITWSFTDNGIQLEGVTATYDGTAYRNPDYATNIGGKKGAPAFCYRDLGIIILKEPVPTSVVSEYGQLPRAGLVDTLPVMTDLTLVGYGFQYHLTPRNSGLQNTWAGLITRNYASAKLLSGNFAWSDEFIRCTANPGQEKGGIAYGDSGGPVFLGQTHIVLAVNSYVTNPNCAGETYHSRIDIPEVLNWIENWIAQEVSTYS